MSTYLLDTNVVSELVHDPDGKVGRTYRAKEREPRTSLLTSIIVVCEIRYGVAKRGAASLAARVDRLLASLEIASLSTGVDDAYAFIRTDLESKGQVIGQNDMLIAAHALALDAILVTDNVREFRRVKGLKIENWLRA